MGRGQGSRVLPLVPYSLESPGPPCGSHPVLPLPGLQKEDTFLGARGRVHLCPGFVRDFGKCSRVFGPLAPHLYWVAKVREPKGWLRAPALGDSLLLRGTILDEANEGAFAGSQGHLRSSSWAGGDHSCPHTPALLVQQAGLIQPSCGHRMPRLQAKPVGKLRPTSDSPHPVAAAADRPQLILIPGSTGWCLKRRLCPQDVESGQEAWAPKQHLVSQETSSLWKRKGLWPVLCGPVRQRSLEEGALSGPRETAKLGAQWGLVGLLGLPLGWARVRGRSHLLGKPGPRDCHGCASQALTLTVVCASPFPGLTLSLGSREAWPASCTALSPK